MWQIEIGPDAVLRPLDPWLAEEFLAHVNRAREHTAPWVPIPHRVVNLETARGYLQKYADTAALDGRRIYGIWLAGTLVGGTTFAAFDVVSGTCEVGVWLEPAGEGRGLITAACTRMLTWAFCERGLHRAEWHVDPRNDRSKAVATRLGMTYEGTLRSTFAIVGPRRDTEIWSVLADEWRAAHPTEAATRDPEPWPS
ncbi:MAG TPA: GNAT family protein [Micromonosporaceae bacterium]|nr:GNAT family protein [Micromonosporaceae bacterium]